MNVHIVPGEALIAEVGSLLVALRQEFPEACFTLAPEVARQLSGWLVGGEAPATRPASDACPPRGSELVLVAGKLSEGDASWRRAIAAGLPVAAVAGPAVQRLLGDAWIPLPTSGSPAAVAAVLRELAQDALARRRLERRARAQARRLERMYGTITSLTEPALHPLPGPPGDTVRVIRDGGIGDLVMLTPALRELSRRHQVHLACDARWISLFRAHPALAAVEDFRGSLSPVARTIDLVRAVDFRGDHPRAEITDRINLFCEAAGVTPADRRPDLHLSSEAHAWADRFCRDLGDFALVQYRATSPFRTYSRMAEVCQQLLAHLPVVAVSDFPWPERPPVARDLCGTTAVENVAAVVGRAAVVVAPDSGCLHLAGAQGVPVVGLFGPYPPSLRLEHYAWKRALRAAPDCPPCFEDPVRCGQMPPPCLLGIDPAQVVREALALMRLRAQAR